MSDVLTCPDCGVAAREGVACRCGSRATAPRFVCSSCGRLVACGMRPCPCHDDGLCFDCTAQRMDRVPGVVVVGAGRDVLVRELLDVLDQRAERREVLTLDMAEMDLPIAREIETQTLVLPPPMLDMPSLRSDAQLFGDVRDGHLFARPAHRRRRDRRRGGR